MNFESRDIVILGHLAKDIIKIDKKSHISLGGAVYYGGLAGSHMGLKITIITRLRGTDFELLNVFEKNGIYFYAYPSEQTSGLKNIYSSKNLEHRNYQLLGFAGLFQKEEIPEINTRFFVIGPITAGEIDLELLEFLKSKYPKNLCLDIQGFIRFREKKKVYYSTLSLKEKKQIISNVCVLKLDKIESEILTGQKSIVKAAKELISLGSKEILITHEKGISIFSYSNSYYFPWKNNTTLGRTGRGDTAFISYVGSRISKGQEQSLKFAAALTSLKLEIPGAFNLPLYLVEDLIKKEY